MLCIYEPKLTILPLKASLSTLFMASKDFPLTVCCILENLFYLFVPNELVCPKIARYGIEAKIIPLVSCQFCHRESWLEKDIQSF